MYFNRFLIYDVSKKCHLTALLLNRISASNNDKNTTPKQVDAEWFAEFSGIKKCKGG